MLRVVERAQQVRDRAVRLARLNIELAQVELKRKARLYGIAAVLGVIAIVLALYALGFLFAAVAAGIAEALPLWASLLVVGGLLAVASAIIALVAARIAKKAGPPRPDATVVEAQATAQELRDG